jgi:tetratricopeptide (TPR) repeat protein
MADIKFILVGLLLIVGGSFIGGCDESKKKAPEEEYTFGDTELQKFDLQKRLEKRYSDPKSHYQLGKIYQSEGLWDKAIFHFKAALSYDPINWASAAATVKVLYQDGKKIKAINTTDLYTATANYSAGSLLSLGEAFQKEMLDDEALTCYHKALKIAPNSADLNKQIGYYYYEKKDLIRAEQYFRRSFEIKPSSEVSGALGKLGISVELPRRELSVPEEPAPDASDE